MNGERIHFGSAEGAPYEPGGTGAPYRLHYRQGLPACVFCGDRPTSREHLLPKYMREWLHRTFGATAGMLHTIRTGPMPELQIPAAQLQKRKGPEQGETLKVLCEPCNNVWSNNIQEAARPAFDKIVRSALDVTTSEEREAFARWLALHLMTFEFRDDNSRTASEQTRRAFRKHGVMPENMLVFYRFYDGVAFQAAAEHIAFNARAFRANAVLNLDDTQTHGIAFNTIAFGRVIFHVIRTEGLSRNPEHASTVQDAFDRAVAKARKHQMAHFWPSFEPVTLLPLHDDEAVDLSHSIATPEQRAHLRRKGSGLQGSSFTP